MALAEDASGTNYFRTFAHYFCTYEVCAFNKVDFLNYSQMARDRRQLIQYDFFTLTQAS
jgi:hypothetical protein